MRLIEYLSKITPDWHDLGQMDAMNRVIERQNFLLLFFELEASSAGNVLALAKDVKWSIKNVRLLVGKHLVGGCFLHNAVFKSKMLSKYDE